MRIDVLVVQGTGEYVAYGCGVGEAVLALEAVQHGVAVYVREMVCCCKAVWGYVAQVVCGLWVWYTTLARDAIWGKTLGSEVNRFYWSLVVLET